MGGREDGEALRREAAVLSLIVVILLDVLSRSLSLADEAVFPLRTKNVNFCLLIIANFQVKN